MGKQLRLDPTTGHLLGSEEIKSNISEVIEKSGEKRTGKHCTCKWRVWDYVQTRKDSKENAKGERTE